LEYFAAVPQVRRLLSQIRPDVLHVHYASGYGTLARLAGFHPYILSVWGSDIFEFPKRSMFHKFLLKRNLAAADYLCSTSHVMAQEAEALGSKQLLVTPFGIDCEKFRPRGADSAPPEGFVIGTVRSLDETYGIDLLLRAFRLFVDRHEGAPVQLTIVGGGPRETEYRNLAKTIGLSSLVNFTGRVPHSAIPGYLQRFSLFVALSKAESFGVAVLEASASGLPVVASDVGGLPEVILDGETGFLVPVHDVAAAAARIEELYLDPVLRSRVGERGREWVLRKYEWSKAAKIVEDLYGRICDGDKNKTRVNLQPGRTTLNSSEGS